MTTSLQYRRDIDGLRAVAVIPVVLYHAGVPGFGAGFIGVDIFFVIGGYLITQLIAAEIEAGTFSTLAFYERRARRILPALFTVLACSAVAFFVFGSPDELSAFGESAIAALLFASNFYFWSLDQYFAAGAHEQPLLHTWSLAVEEQFYILFPLALALVLPKGRMVAILCIAGAALASYMAAHQFTASGDAQSGFFLPQCRVWELLVGAIVAAWAMSRRLHVPLGQELGLLLILASFVTTTSNDPWPGPMTIPPVLGTAIILACQHQSATRRILSSAPLVGVGLCSYSFYLWHQPVLALIFIESDPSPVTLAAAILGSFVLAVFSWRFVETPFRNRNRMSRRSAVQFCAASFTVLLGVSFAFVTSNGIPQRYRGIDALSRTERSPMREQCHFRSGRVRPPQESCVLFGDNATWAVLGDSHAVELSYALALAVQERGESVMQFSFSGCLPTKDLDAQVRGCTEWLRASTAYLESNPDIERVAVNFYHANYLYRAPRSAGKGMLDVDPNALQARVILTSGIDPETDYWNGVRNIVARLSAAGKTIYLIYPAPELPFDLEKVLTPSSIFSTKSASGLAAAVSLADYKRRNGRILAQLDSISELDRVVKINPIKAWCNETTCPAVNHGHSLYFDDNHLSLYGAGMIAREILNASNELSVQD